MLPSPRKLIAIAVGVLLAGAPMMALDLWIDSVILRQGANDTETFAKRSVSLAEMRLGMALKGLEDLSKAGVDDCRPEHSELMKSTGLSIPWVKQMAVLGAAGQPLCGDLDLGGAPVSVISSRSVRNSPALLEVVQIGDRPQRMVRLRQPAGRGPNSLSALLPSEVLVARMFLQSPIRGTYGQLALDDGTLIDEAGTRPQDSEALSALGGNARFSDKFGLRVATSYPQVDHGTTLAGLREIATSMTGIFALLLIGFALLLRRRERGGPVDELARALKAGEFVPYYQPTVDIITGKLRGAEVLMRWKKRDGSVLPPAAFIPLAESSGLIIEMTHSMMRHVIADLGEACAARPKLRLGFNMTAQHFANERIVRDLRVIFERSPIVYSQIVLEVTERQPLENLSRTRRVIAALQELGVRVAIDDVGTGHGGLSYILKLGADIIKIDKMFVDALGHDNHSSTIIETLVDLANSMRMEVIAEGVETFEQVIALRERGIRSAQGYVFAPPLPASSFLQLLNAVDPRSQKPEREPDTLRQASAGMMR
ncbi:MAG: EAL domain-containing protein [Pseudorhodoplanes sp.]